jgi:nucleotidyltransferase/DNA polymerase involved in DNA repair
MQNQESKAQDQEVHALDQDCYNRLIIHIDMDAYYAGVEMKKHNIPASQPLGVLQWKSLIAINYSAKSKGVKRGMLSHEALVVCPEMKFAHVSTLCLDKNGQE